MFDPSSLEHLNVRARATNGQLDSAIETARSVLAREDMPEATKAMARRDLARLEEIKADGGLEPHQGRMYEVNIDAAPNQFLDWDAPLSAQSDEVLAALPRGAGVNDEMAGAMLQRGYRNEMFGGDLIGANRATPDEVTAGLRDRGIAGIRYLDAVSRGAGDGSRNYVVFDNNIVEILRKYGIAGLSAGGGGGLLARARDQSSAGT